ncbi:MAG: ribosome maturation factor RimP [Agathobaculum sp.]|uniref:ribosome maturation factor RimP n=1 Tax=Agathobaculum sp. TaxID=2048138 RepID=UPI002A82C27E|nr:ribosome maturation factor RimP [Agathobaculum sp.]MDY3712332.1 ribosome maturation factor RimP [Agathobaculum sp.]
MQAKQIVARVEELVRPLCAAAGVSLWDVEFGKEGGQYMLTVTVDHPEGVSIDQCEQVSRALDPMLDEKEFDDMPSYTLCVSSAGLSRRLARPEHFAAFIGHTVEVGFYKPVDGAKQVEGTLVSYDDGRVTLERGGQQTIYEPKDIAAVRLAVEI